MTKFKSSHASLLAGDKKAGTSRPAVALSLSGLRPSQGLGKKREDGCWVPRMTWEPAAPALGTEDMGLLNHHFLASKVTDLPEAERTKDKETQPDACGHTQLLTVQSTDHQVH